jgi:RNA polymerase sigma-70 factor (ECF subfamily)
MECKSTWRVSANDDTLVSSGLRGDEDAFNELFSRHQRLLYSLAFRVLQNHEEAEDAVQSSLLRAFRNLPRLACQGAFRGWLARILVNETLAILRKRKCRPMMVTRPDAADEQQGDWLDSFTSRQVNPEQTFAQAEFVTAFENSMACLSAPLRSAIVLCDIAETTIEEAGSVLGVKPNTIKARLFRGRRKIREKMVGYAFGG